MRIRTELLGKTILRIVHQLIDFSCNVIKTVALPSKDPPLGQTVSHIPSNLLSTKAAGPEQIRLLNNSLSHHIYRAF